MFKVFRILFKFTKYFWEALFEIRIWPKFWREVGGQLNLTWCELEFTVAVLCKLWTWVDLCVYICRLSVFVGNDVSLFESQQLDECNNNIQDDDDVVVLPSAPRSKTSSNSSSPSPSLRSSPSSSPLSPSSTSSTSSSSDVVSLAVTDLQILYCCIWLWRDYLAIHFVCFPQDSDGTPCKTAKQQAGRGPSAHREKSAVVSNHRTQSHATSSSSGSNKGGKVCSAWSYTQTYNTLYATRKKKALLNAYYWTHHIKEIKGVDFSTITSPQCVVLNSQGKSCFFLMRVLSPGQDISASPEERPPWAA